MTREHAGGDGTVGVGVALLLKMTQNILMFGKPYAEHCVYTRHTTEWFAAYISDSKIIHKNCNQKHLQPHKHAAAKHVKLFYYETRNNTGNVV